MSGNVFLSAEDRTRVPVRYLLGCYLDSDQSAPRCVGSQEVLVLLLLKADFYTPGSPAWTSLSAVTSSS